MIYNSIITSVGDDVDIDMVSATDSDASFYVSLHGAFKLIKIEFFLFKEFYC